jgi:RNA methyltransferase, TrmH family
LVKTITSRHNPIVSRFRSLADAPDPTGTHLLLDGAHLVRDARRSELFFDVVAVASSKLHSNSEEGRLAQTLASEGVDVIDTSDEVFDALSPVRTPSGIAAIVERRPSNASAMCARDEALLLVAIDVQEPGNVGALLRSAEAGGVSGAFVCGASANPFSWKAVRGSMGSALRLPIVANANTDAVLACLKDAGARLVATIPRGGDDPDTLDWRGKIAIVLGGEGPGLPMGVLANCDASVSIPMAKHVESLNVAVAAAILVYAARRSRRA